MVSRGLIFPAAVWLTAASFAAVFVGPALAEDAVPDMTLEELVNADVVSVSRKSQNLQQTPAAVFVITQEDIARSGARTLADVLAMAPGIEVAQIGNNRWAVSARGYNGRFANKLQVLKDGRSIYSPLFSGVFWEAEDTVLEDIERIEVIRGPNAATWGANAMNGAINIITKKARDTQGGLVSLRAGSEDKGTITARYGFAAGDQGHMRIYAKASATRAGFSVADPGQRSVDHSQLGRVGLRGDWLLAPGQRLSVNGELFNSKTGDVYLFPDPLARRTAYVSSLDSTMGISGGHLQTRFDSLQDNGAEFSLQASLGHTTLNAADLLRESRTTLDLDAQYHFVPLGIHDLIVGGTYRHSQDTIENLSRHIVFNTPKRDFQLFTLFVNDEITLAPEKFRIILGALLEKNSFTGVAFQPTARFLWTPTPQQTVWGAVSHANRTPSRAQADVNLIYNVLPPMPPRLPVPIAQAFVAQGAESLAAEKMNALELGYRQQFNPRLSLDVTAFWQRYRGLGIRMSTVDRSTLPLYLKQNFAFFTGLETAIRGVEAALFAQLTPTWRLQPSYTYLDGSAPLTGDTITDMVAQREMGRIPRHQFSLRSQHNIANNHQLDFWLKYKSRNRTMNLPDTANLDIRYAWKAARNAELSLAGQNLLHRRTVSYTSDPLASEGIEVGRSAYLRFEYRF